MQNLIDMELFPGQYDKSLNKQVMLKVFCKMLSSLISIRVCE